MDSEVRMRILNAAIMAFNEDGVKFTMDSVAGRIGISKKTIYKFFSGKDEMILAAINAGFDEVKAAEQEIIKDESLDIVEKLKRVIIVIPDQYMQVDWRRLNEFADYSPEAFALLNKRITSGWDSTFALFKRAVKEKKIRNINPLLFKNMIESCISGFISSDLLVNEGIAYQDALQTMIDIMIDGIRV